MFDPTQTPLMTALQAKAVELNIPSLKQSVENHQYDFLLTAPHLGQSQIIMLTLGGSYAYGTNLPTSDVDIRGISIPKKNTLYGLSTFEQHIDKPTDTTVYNLLKFVKLCAACNPNIIEMLGCKPEHYLYLTKEGQTLLDNRKLFLSQSAPRAFIGFATQQLRRLQNAIARDKPTQEQREEHILASINSSMQSFDDRYTAIPEGSLHAHLIPSAKEHLDTEIALDISLKNYPARDFTAILHDILNTIKNYDELTEEGYTKLNKSNRKKDDAHLNKHAMHLLRLYYMCINILEQGEIITYRTDEHDLLMSVRNGKFMTADRTILPEFFDILHDLQERLDYAKRNTSLPQQPNYKQLEELAMSIIESHYNI